MDEEKVLEFLNEYESLCKKHGIMFDSDYNRVWIVKSIDDRIVNVAIESHSAILGSGI